LNYPEFPDSCPPLQLALFKDILNVLIDRSHVLLEQFRQLPLRQPDRLVLQPHFNARTVVLGLVEDDLGLGFRLHALKQWWNARMVTSQLINSHTAENRI
jgi:hypothetical protein